MQPSKIHEIDKKNQVYKYNHKRALDNPVNLTSY